MSLLECFQNFNSTPTRLYNEKKLKIKIDVFFPTIIDKSGQH